MIRRYQVRILGQASRQIPREGLIVRPVLLDDVNDVPNSVVRKPWWGRPVAVQFCRSFCGKSRQSRGVRSGDNFERSLFKGHNRVTTNVGIWSPAIGWVGHWLGRARVGICGSVTRGKPWSEAHARSELKLIAAAARCPNRSLGQPPRWLLRNDSGASRTPVHEIGRKEL